MHHRRQIPGTLFEKDPDTSEPAGLKFEQKAGGSVKPKIKDHLLFEVLVNNPYLPDKYKEVMVLRPGIQGGSEIVGEWIVEDVGSHVFEYLRRNSYIPWGHYAANMADDAVRYRIKDLSFEDMKGLRHLYYQRTFIRLADQLGIKTPDQQKMVLVSDLEEIRQQIAQKLKSRQTRDNLFFNRTLWGWNFGFDYAPSQYRLHGSHQQIHQQYAMIPGKLASADFTPYACGDLIEDFLADYRDQTGVFFFDAFISAIRNNKRTDGKKEREQSLIVYEDEDIMVFVPKAQTSQWELQMMTVNPVGNILEADVDTRLAIDRGMHIAVNVLSAMGARMITSIEFSKRLDLEFSDQRLLYTFLPKLPESPGTFSEAQLRWINGHYPEDFAIACRAQLEKLNHKLP